MGIVAFTAINLKKMGLFSKSTTKNMLRENFLGNTHTNVVKLFAKAVMPLHMA